MLVRNPPKYDLSLTKATLSLIGRVGILFQLWVWPPWLGFCLPMWSRPGPPDSITPAQWCFVYIEGSGYLGQAWRRLGAGGQEGGNDSVKTSMKGECFGNPKGSFLLPGILKVLPKEAACLLPSNSTKERNLGKMFRPSAAVVCVLLPTAGCVPACWFRHFSLVPGAFLVWQITDELPSKLGLGCLRLLHLKPAAVCFPSSTSQTVLQVVTSEKCSLRTLFINLFAQPRAYSNETELVQQLVWGEPKSFLAMRSILLTLGEKLQRHKTARTSSAGCGDSENQLMVTRGEGQGQTGSLGFTYPHYCI